MPRLKLTQKVFSGLYEAYGRILQIVAGDARLRAEAFVISNRAFADAMREAVTDYNILCSRRPFNHGISRGKWAGTFVFRLVRNNVLHLTPAVDGDKDALHMSIHVALAFGLEFIGLYPKMLPCNLLRELRYHLAKRHINQESLGICFECLEWGASKCVEVAARATQSGQTIPAK